MTQTAPGKAADHLQGDVVTRTERLRPRLLSTLSRDLANERLQAAWWGGKHAGEIERGSLQLSGDGLYANALVPLLMVRANEAGERLDGTVDIDRARRYAESEIVAPVCLRYGPRTARTRRASVSDGGHRVTAARLRGDAMIPAILPLTELEAMMADFDELLLGEGGLRPWRNSTGAAIHPTARGIENFRRWFGDSQATDAQGRPQVFYHGTTVREGLGDITAFDRLKTTEFRRQSIDTVGSWFSDNPGIGGSEMYAGGGLSAAIYPVYLAIRNPKVYAHFEDVLDDMHRAAGRDPARQNPRGVGSTEELRARLKAEGYDGIRFARTDNQSLHEMTDALRAMLNTVDAETRRVWELPETTKADRDALRQRRHEADRALQDHLAKLAAKPGSQSTEFDRQSVWVAFEPEQIKSVFNGGAFDPYSPSLTDSQPTARYQAEAWARERTAIDPVCGAAEAVAELAATGAPADDERWQAIGDGLVDLDLSLLMQAGEHLALR